MVGYRKHFIPLGSGTHWSMVNGPGLWYRRNKNSGCQQPKVDTAFTKMISNHKWDTSLSSRNPIHRYELSFLKSPPKELSKRFNSSSSFSSSQVQSLAFLLNFQAREGRQHDIMKKSTSSGVKQTWEFESRDCHLPLVSCEGSHLTSLNSNPSSIN